MHKITINTINNNADGAYFNKWLNDNYDNYIGYSFTTEVLIYFSSVLDPYDEQEIIDKYESLTDIDVLVLENNEYQYYLRGVDGLNWYSSLRSAWFQEYNEEAITLENEHYRQIKIKAIKEFVILGDWLDGQYEINNLLDGGLVSQEDIDNSYTQEVHDSIKSSIDQYVLNNY
jgi:hypothetical protein